MFAVGKTATFLLDNKIEGSKIMINCDSQAAIKAINSTFIKNSIILEAIMTINTLGKSNEITLRWIPAHCGYEVNEVADQLEKVLTMTADRATRPGCVCYAALRKKNYSELDQVLQMNKRNLPAATQILTGQWSVVMLVLIIISAN